MPQSLACNTIAKYFPLSNGQYEVKPGLFSLQHDFGNFEQDGVKFQFDQQFSIYRENKLAARNEKLSQYFCTSNFPDTQQRYIAQYIIETLCNNYPDYFILSDNDKTFSLRCMLTNEVIVFSDYYELISCEHTNYINLLDAIIMQVQEDVAIITHDDQLSCLHLMAPNFWSAEDKIGHSFNSIHQDVAGFEQITKNSKSILQAMIHKGPFVRFAWGICSDDLLNHHPKLTLESTSSNQQGRSFNINNPCLFLRVERQTISGLADIKCAMFTIRTYHYNIEELSKIEIQSVISAIASMTQEQLIYKGLNSNKPAIINWLTSLL